MGAARGGAEGFLAECGRQLQQVRESISKIAPSGGDLGKIE